ncbi:MAG: carbonic anhydrase [Pirellulales bacterium]
MRNLVQGVRRFRTEVFAQQREYYKKLAAGQHPQALFITCSDSRVVPNLITQTAPGELFVLRNAGNIIPPPGAASGGEAATIEFAIEHLNVEHIIVCGHTQCGAMKALVNPGSADSMPTVAAWLKYAEATRRVVSDNYQDYSGDALVNIAAQEHVLMQLEILQTHPAVASRLVHGALTLHGWMFKIEAGQVFAYDDAQGLFLPLSDTAEADEAPAEAAATTV